MGKYAVTFEPRLHDKRLWHGTLNFGTVPFIHSTALTRLHDKSLPNCRTKKNSTGTPIIWHGTRKNRAQSTFSAVNISAGKFKYGGFQPSTQTQIAATLVPS